MAAVHAGLIDEDEGGEFVFIVANGLSSYESSLQNKV